METIGIIFSIPEAFLAGSVYRFLLLRAQLHWTWIKPLFLAPSYAVLAGLLAEWLLLATRGAVGTRLLIGALYYPIHTLIFFLGMSVLVNVLVLPDPSRRQARWWFSLPLCTLLGFVLGLQSIAVSEALYGIDDSGGPFSQSDGR
jgi:hypothetical protein